MSFDKESYVARVSSATPIQLIVINYEIALEYINAGINSLNEKDYIEFKNNISKAVKSVEQLMSSLKMEYEISGQIMPLYIYINECLNKSLSSKDIELIKISKNILEELLTSWSEIAKNDLSEKKVLNTSQKLYAGLTYSSDGQLNEFIDEDNSKQYRA